MEKAPQLEDVGAVGALIALALDSLIQVDLERMPASSDFGITRLVCLAAEVYGGLAEQKLNATGIDGEKKTGVHRPEVAVCLSTKCQHEHKSSTIASRRHVLPILRHDPVRLSPFLTTAATTFLLALEALCGS